MADTLQMTFWMYVLERNWLPFIKKNPTKLRPEGQIDKKSNLDQVMAWYPLWCGTPEMQQQALTSLIAKESLKKIFSYFQSALCQLMALGHQQSQWWPIFYSAYFKLTLGILKFKSWSIILKQMTLNSPHNIAFIGEDPAPTPNDMSICADMLPIAGTVCIGFIPFGI